jgi:SAM-dependent methyltransferase
MTERPAALPPMTLGARLRWDVVERLLPAGGGSLLEIGCGQGAAGVRLAHRYDYLGLEPDRASYDVAVDRIARWGRGEVRNSDTSILDSGRMFDVVCAFEVLEHIEDDHAALEDWIQLVRPGGALLLSTPAHQRRFGPSDIMVGHYRRYDPAAMAALLSRAGLVDVKVVLYGFPLGYALETARNAIGRRRVASAGRADGCGHSMHERTGHSGRLFQPRTRLTGAALAALAAPFVILQRPFPQRGTGLVAAARRPPQ